MPPPDRAIGEGAQPRAPQRDVAPFGEAGPGEESAAHDPVDLERGDIDPVRAYLEQISRTPLLDAAEEVELAKAIEAGLYAQRLLDQGGVADEPSRAELEVLAEEGLRAKERFIAANLRLVVSVARRYPRPDLLSLLDLIQDGNLGLIRAVEKFDYRRGYKFSTYATWWIRQAISRARAQRNRLVRLPVNVADEVSRLARVRRDLARDLAHQPTDAEVAAAMGVAPQRLADLDRWAVETISLDRLVGDDAETPLGELIEDVDAPGPEAIAIARDARERLEALIGLLDPRAAEVVRSRFGLRDGRVQSAAEIAARLGISRPWVQHIEARAIARLRTLTAGEDIDAA